MISMNKQLAIALTIVGIITLLILFMVLGGIGIFYTVV